MRINTVSRHCNSVVYHPSKFRLSAQLINETTMFRRPDVLLQWEYICGESLAIYIMKQSIPALHGIRIVNM
jgi:hypothetical protein